MMNEVIYKDGHRIDHISQGILRTLYNSDEVWLETGDLTDALAGLLDRHIAEEDSKPEAIKYRVDEHLHPAGLVNTRNPGLDEYGGNQPRKYRLTTTGKQWIGENTGVLIEPWVVDQPVEKRVEQLEDRVAVLSNGELTGSPTQDIVERVDALEDRVTEIENRLDVYEGDLDELEETVGDLIDLSGGEVDAVTRDEFQRLVDEVNGEMEKLYRAAGWDVSGVTTGIFDGVSGDRDESDDDDGEPVVWGLDDEV